MFYAQSAGAVIPGRASQVTQKSFEMESFVHISLLSVNTEDTGRNGKSDAKHVLDLNVKLWWDK